MAPALSHTSKFVVFSVVALTLFSNPLRSQQQPAAPPTSPTPAQWTPMTKSEKVRASVRNAVGPPALVGPAILAFWDLGIDRVPEWPSGGAGYIRYYGDRFGRNAIRESIELTFDLALGHDPRYFRSPHPGVWRRTRHALKQTVFNYNDQGKRVVGYPNIFGAYGSGLISGFWYPPSRNSFASGLGRGTGQLGINAGTNVFYEFWPDIRRLVFGRKRGASGPLGPIAPP
ncbi:MAG: hypothetical protein ACK5AZ_17900 [Bryobacteraceae bacterium]